MQCVCTYCVPLKKEILVEKNYLVIFLIPGNKKLQGKIGYLLIFSVYNQKTFAHKKQLFQGTCQQKFLQSREKQDSTYDKFVIKIITVFLRLSAHTLCRDLKREKFTFKFTLNEKKQRNFENHKILTFWVALKRKNTDFFYKSLIQRVKQVY
eukprot:TRINITY_DN1759_c0_g1_i2.p5 TRINITY_DN1759_c0_g1~~TRINITY_DN1759_c0_g1_i2.p5  ORF type:complete len:152 (+),score=1.07 TRINITY_DN1759_c0_g1_i2:871-1326(+)